MKEEILALLKEIAPSVDFTASDTLADDGLVDGTVGEKGGHFYK